MVVQFLHTTIIADIHSDSTLPPETIHSNPIHLNINTHLQQWWIGEESLIPDATDAYEHTFQPSWHRHSAHNCSLGFEDGMEDEIEDEMDSGACGKKETEPGGVDREGMDKCLSRWAGRKIMEANTISINTTNDESNQQQHRH